MAGEALDRVIVEGGYQDVGVDRGLEAAHRQVLAFAATVERVSRSLPPLDLDTRPLRSSVDRALTDFDRLRRLSAGPEQRRFTLDVSGVGEAVGALETVERTVARVSDRTRRLQILPSPADLAPAASAVRQVATEATAFERAMDGVAAKTRALATAAAQPVDVRVEAAPAVAAVDTLLARLNLARRTAAEPIRLVAPVTPAVPAPPPPAALARGGALVGPNVAADAGQNLERARRHLEAFATAVQQVARTLPVVTLRADGSQVESARVALERFVRESQGVTALPSLVAPGALRELQELSAQFGGLDAALARSDPAGILRRLSAESRVAVGDLQRVAEQLAALAATPPPGARPVAPQVRAPASVAPDLAAAAIELRQSVTQAGALAQALDVVGAKGRALVVALAQPLTVRADATSAVAALDVLAAQVAATRRLAAEPIRVAAPVAAIAPPIPGAVGTDAEQSLERAQRRLDALAATVQQVAGALPVLMLRADASQVEAARAVLERFLRESSGVTALPSLVSPSATREVKELSAAFGGLDALLGRFDPTGVLRRMAEDSRLAVAGLEGVATELGRATERAAALQRVATISPERLLPASRQPLLLAPPAPLPPPRAPATDALRDSLAATGEATRRLVQIEQGFREAGAAISQVIGGPLDQLAQRLRSVSAIPVGLDLAPLIAALSGGEQATGTLTRSIRDGAVAELQRLGATSAEVAAALRGLASAPPITVNAQPAQASLDGLIAKLGGLRRSVADPLLLVSPQVTSPTAPTPAATKVVDDGTLARLAQQHRQLAAAEVLSGDGAQRMAAGFRVAGQQAAVLSRETRNTIAGTEAWARGLANLNGQQQRLAMAVGDTTQGMSRLRGGLTAIAVQASGTSPAVGAVVSGLLLLGPGSAAVLGVAAGVAVIAAAYRLLTHDSREAADKQKALNDELDRAARTRHPLSSLTENAAAVGQQLDEITARIKRLRETQGQPVAAFDLSQARFGTAETGRRTIDNTRAIAQAEAEQLQVRTRLLEVGEQLHDFFADTPQARALADAAREEAQARERAAEAARRQREEMERHLEALQREARLQAAGGGNRPQNAGPVTPGAVAPVVIPPPAPVVVPVILRGVHTGGLQPDEFGALRREQARAAEGAQKLSTELDAVLAGLDDISRSAASIGLIGQQADQAFNSVLGLVGSLGQLKAANEAKRAAAGTPDKADDLTAQLSKFSAVAGVISSAFSVAGPFLSQVFGKSEGERERDRILAQNNERLEQLRASLDRSIDSAAGLGNAQRAIQSLQGTDLLKLAGLSSSGNPLSSDVGRRAQEELDRQVKAAGSSLKELDRIAEANGFDLLDSKGRLVADAFGQLDEVLKLVIKQATTLADTFTEQSSAAELDARLRGLPQDDRARFERELQQAQRFSPAVQQAFQGVDLGNEAALRAAAVDLFARFRSGGFEQDPAGTLGTLGKDEFLRLMNDAADYLDTFGASVRDATQELGSLNVPQGFKSEKFAFLAQDPGGPGATPGGGGTLGAVPLPPPGPKGTDFTPEFSARFSADVSEAIGRGLATTPTRAPADQLVRLDRMADQLTGIASSTPPDLLAALQQVADAVARSRTGETGAPSFSRSGSGAAAGPQGSDGAALPAFVSSGLAGAPGTVTQNEVHLNITINPGPNASPKEIAREATKEMLRELRRLGLAQTGDTLQIPFT